MKLVQSSAYPFDFEIINFEAGGMLRIERRSPHFEGERELLALAKFLSC